jgi:rhodanese-related sulfurtransferase
MMQKIKNMLGMGTKTDYGELVKQGAIILDVRSRTEFSGGHIQNAINIPVDELNDNLSKLKDRNKCIICCCASGMRSGAAKRILESKGYTAVYNGGGWVGLKNKL